MKNAAVISKSCFPLREWMDHDTQLLLKTLVMGLSDIALEYKNYLTLIHEEV